LAVNRRVQRCERAGVKCRRSGKTDIEASEIGFRTRAIAGDANSIRAMERSCARPPKR
jgi:hypothetical protein